MKRNTMIAVCMLALMATPGVMAKPKKAKAAAQTAPAPVVRILGYAVIELENGARDKLRVAEGESRATLPNIMAGDVDFITVVGAQTIVTVYDDANFRGHSLTLRCGNYELLQQPRNAIESIKVSFVKTPVSECQGSKGQPVQYKDWDR